ncbi:hypothetical protein QYE76_014852 [Lolium multiflorum]|uniref:CCHC-type domain-containing protein n=1 Tax=Lolium multiflorum TaxID=4521 RepID=A0AAD8U1G3_LOLMU|nr:hypothetical protein QYE76_014852 [Lolium multiflorum]
MIQTSVGTKELSRVRNFTTAKEAWDGLAASCIGSESTRRNKYNSLRNKAEGFMRLPDEDHEDMYARLITVADAFRNLGATHINDSWIKDKYIDCMMPFEPIDVKTLVGRECYSSLTSQQAVHEMQALKVLEQNSHDSRNRAIGMSKGNNLSLTVNSVEEVHPQEQYRASWSMSYPEDLELHYNDHMAFHARSFWVDPSKAKEDNIKRNNSSGSTSLGPRTRSCYNCGDKRHFIAQCPYEHRETHGGRLIPKDKSKDSKGKDSKPPNKKFYNNKTKKGKRPPRVVLVTREEYSSDEVESSSDDEEQSSKEVATIVTTNIPSSSLFESPNENPHIKNAHCFMARSSLDTPIVLSTQEEYTSGDDDVDDEEDDASNGLVALASLSTNSSSPSESPNEIIHVEEESYLMAKSSEVSSPSPSMTNISSDLGVDDASLKVKQEMLELDEFIFNLQGLSTQSSTSREPTPEWGPQEAHAADIRRAIADGDESTHDSLVWSEDDQSLTDGESDLRFLLSGSRRRKATTTAPGTATPPRVKEEEEDTTSSDEPPAKRLAWAGNICDFDSDYGDASEEDEDNEGPAGGFSSSEDEPAGSSADDGEDEDSSGP